MGAARSVCRDDRDAAEPVGHGVQRRRVLRPGRAALQDVVHGRLPAAHCALAVSSDGVALGAAGLRHRAWHEHRPHAAARFEHRVARSRRARSGRALQDGRVHHGRPAPAAVDVARRHSLARARGRRAVGRSQHLLLQSVSRRLGVQPARRHTPPASVAIADTSRRATSRARSGATAIPVDVDRRRSARRRARRSAGRRRSSTTSMPSRTRASCSGCSRCSAASAPNARSPTTSALGFSRDGFHWDRTWREPFLSVSERQGDWNWGNVQSAGGCCLVVGDQLYFYVSGQERRAGHRAFRGRAAPASPRCDATALRR